MLRAVGLVRCIGDSSIRERTQLSALVESSVLGSLLIRISFSELSDIRYVHVFGDTVGTYGTGGL